MERWPEYEAALRRLIEIRWNSCEGLVQWVTSQYRLAKVYELTGKPDGAIVCYRQFVDLWGDADSKIPQIELAQRRLEALGS